MVMGNDPVYSRMRDNFGLFCDEAARFNLVPTIEFVPTRPLCTMEMAIRIINEFGLGHRNRLHRPSAFRPHRRQWRQISIPAKYFPYTQLNDGVVFPGEPNPTDFGKMPQGQRKMLGKGDVPLAEFLDAFSARTSPEHRNANRTRRWSRDVKAKPYSSRREWAVVALKAGAILWANITLPVRNPHEKILHIAGDDRGHKAARLCEGGA